MNPLLFTEWHAMVLNVVVEPQELHSQKQISVTLPVADEELTNQKLVIKVGLARKELFHVA